MELAPAPSVRSATSAGGKSTYAASSTTASNAPEPSKESAYEGNPDEELLMVHNDAKPMSRKALKRQRLEEQWQAKRQAMKERRKDERKARQEKRRELREKGELPPPKPRFHPNPESTGVQLVIDLDFKGQMNQKEIKSLVKQLQFCYAANRKASHNVQLTATGLIEEVAQVLRSQNTSHERWQSFPFVTESYLERFNKDDLVYLTGDSPNVLTSLEPGKAYVIGGLVDHNRLKRFCLNRAERDGIAHAQLPIGDFVQLNSRKVLTVNHCVEIILHVLANGGNWREALEQCIPQRKIASEKSEADIGSVEEDRTPERLVGAGPVMPAKDEDASDLKREHESDSDADAEESKKLKL